MTAPLPPEPPLDWTRLSGWGAAGAAAVAWCVQLWREVRGERSRGRQARAEALGAEIAATEAGNAGLFARLTAALDRYEAELRQERERHQTEVAAIAAAHAATVADLERQVEGRDREIEVLEGELRRRAGPSPS